MLDKALVERKRMGPITSYTRSVKNFFHYLLVFVGWFMLDKVLENRRKRTVGYTHILHKEHGRSGLSCLFVCSFFSSLVNPRGEAEANGLCLFLHKGYARSGIPQFCLFVCACLNASGEKACGQDDIV